MATGICWLDERDLETDFALSVTALDGWPGGLGTAPRDLNPIAGPEMPGALLDPRLLRRAATQATISGILDAGSMVASRIKLDALTAFLGQGAVRVRTIFAPDRYCLATLAQQAGQPEATGIVNGALVVQLGFLVADGLAWRSTEAGYALSTARTACQPGTDVAFPVIVVHGGGATLEDPEIIVRTAAGDEVQRMTFSTASLAGGVLAATDYLLVDSARAAVTRSAAGTLSAAESLWVSGDFPLIRPADGWSEDGVAPTVELSAAAGAPVGRITYRPPYR